MKRGLSFWMLLAMLAGCAWAQEAVSPDAAAVAEGPVEEDAVPSTDEASLQTEAESADVEVPPANGNPLAEAGAEGVREALDLLPDPVWEALGPEAVRRAAMEGVLRAGDPGVVFTAAGTEAGGEEWHAGMVLTGSKELPRVSWVAPDSPAQAAGIQAGDRVSEVAGEAVAAGVDLSGVRAALGGGEEAALAVKVVPADGGEAREVVLERSRKDAVPGLSGAERLPTGIGYLRLERLKAGAAEDIAQALAAWAEEDQVPAGVVLDLRGADGDASAEGEIAGIAGRFALPGKILYRVDEGTPAARTVAVGAFPGDRFRGPLAVLVDEGTTGAAELLAAALASGAEGAVAIGRPTSGNPLVREARELADGRQAWLAVHAVTTADGRRYDGRAGLEPALPVGEPALDEPVYEPEEPVLRKGKTLSEEEKEDRALRDRTRFDPYLRRAADVLLGLQAIGHAWR